MVPGVVSPAERVRGIHAMAEMAAKGGPEEQRRVAAQLGEMYPREPDPVVRGEIVHALGAYPNPETVGVLLQSLKDKETAVRTTACTALGRQGGPEAAAALRGALSSDTSLDVRLAAVKALGQSRDRDPATIAALGTALDDRNPAMRRLAVNSLRRIAPQDLGNELERWRAYVKGEPPPPPQPVSFAERIRTIF